MDIPYLEYFGLKEKPFEPAFDPRFYFESTSHREAIDHLRFLLRQKEGFALIYGNSGVGKTTLSNIFLGSLDKSKYNTALISNPIMDEIEFLREVLKAFGILTGSDCSDYTKKTMFDKLRNFLLEEYKKGKENLLVIDEAQLLSNELLQFIRILSNIETDKEKILYIILFARPEFVERLKEANMMNLSQRITVIYMLKPFTLNEVNSYINHRLLKAGSKGLLQFEKDAVKLIYSASKGYPGLINILCDRCLTLLFSQSGYMVDENIVYRVLKEHDTSLIGKIRFKPPKIAYIIALIVIALLACLVPLSGIMKIPYKLRFPDYSQKTPLQQETKRTADTSKVLPAKDISKPVSPVSDSVPSPLILASEGEYLLLCEKSSDTLSLFKFIKGTFTLVKAYRCAVGANKQDKQQSGDRATPQGIFFTVRFIPGKDLPKSFGYGAFVLNYPNYLAKKEGKKGDGIWLNGHSDDKNIGKDLLNTKGCIVTDNSSLQEISTYIKPNGTPIVIVDKVKPIEEKNQNESLRELKTFLNSWRKAWESIDTEKHLSFYAPDFISSDGMGYKAFKQHKERVNSTKKVVRVNIENTGIFMAQEYKGEIAVVRFRQKYHSNNFDDNKTKILYLKRKGLGFSIIGEETI
jgi:general secretion pathway protein A